MTLIIFILVFVYNMKPMNHGVTHGAKMKKCSKSEKKNLLFRLEVEENYLQDPYQTSCLSGYYLSKYLTKDQSGLTDGQIHPLELSLMEQKHPSVWGQP